jgi:hypothetical protein
MAFKLGFVRRVLIASGMGAYTLRGQELRVIEGLKLERQQ